MKSTSHGTSISRIRSREEEHRALEHADQQQVAVRRSRRDLGPELAHPVPQLVGLDEDLADRRVAHGRAVRCRWCTRPDRAASGGQRSKVSTPARTRARAPSPRSSAPSAPSARTSSARPATRGARAAERALGQAPDHEPRERRRQLRAGARARSASRPPSTLVDERVEHLGLVAQQLPPSAGRCASAPPGGRGAAPARARRVPARARSAGRRWPGPRGTAGRARGSRPRSPRASRRAAGAPAGPRAAPCRAARGAPGDAASR